MRKMKLFSCIFLSALLSLVFSVSAFAKEELIDDRAGLLSDAEYAEANSALASAKERTGADFFICIYDGYDEELDADRYAAITGYPEILLTIEKRGGTYYYDLYTYGDAYDKITDRELDVILDEPSVYDNLKGGALTFGISAFATVAGDAYLSDIEPFDVSTVLIPLFIALAASVIVCVVILIRYKRKNRSKSYPLNTFASLALETDEDIFLTSHVTRTRIQKSSSGGGARGSGGGHRGGR